MRTFLAATLLGAGAALAAPGALELSFGQGGFATLPPGAIADRADRARFVTTDAEGRVLAIGEASRPTDGPEGAVRVFARFLPGGLPDASLAGTGYLHTLPDPLLDAVGLRAFPVAGGKTLLVAQHRTLCWPPRPACALAIATPYFFAQRVDAAGQVDPAYGVMATVSMDTVQQDVAASPDGSLTVVGYQHPPVPPGDPIFDVRGVDPAGQLFTPWFPARAAWDCGTAADGSANSAKMARQADGRFLLAQQVRGPTGANRLCVSRLNPDATLDAGYGDGGRLRIDDARFAVVPVTIHALAVRLGGGAVMVLETSFPAAPREVFLAWLTEGGALDASRGTQGIAGPLSLPIHGVAAAALQADDKILLAGYPPLFAKTPPILVDLASPRIVRLDAAGDPDPGFGPAGEGFAPLFAPGRRLQPLHIHAGEANVIHVAGSLVESGSGGTRFAVARLEGDPPPRERRGLWGTGCGFGFTRPIPPDPTLPALALAAAALLLARGRRPG
ncbi:MAG: hypothetical protein AB7P08_00780 [Burkholderiales bacterium]